MPLLGDAAYSHGTSFANVSAVTGLDFPDDGRGLAMVDWDRDGDLDLWLANRTGPRLRLMLNRGADGNAFVAFRLRGTTSNRDAIGARVEVELEDSRGGMLARTIYAGDAFLSQSSKWLHFGLGRDPGIERVTVRWPGGEVETFAGVEPGRRYLLVEGRGLADPVERPQAAEEAVPVVLESSAQVLPATSTMARAFLPVPVPLPRLRYARFENPGEPAVLVEAGPEGPLLINFWATWCLPCITELKELTARKQQLEAAGLGVLALSVDGLAQDHTTRPADAEKLLRRIGFPFSRGLATVELLEKVELVDEALFDRSRPFTVPASFLLDRDGQLAAIYRGRVDLVTLARDVAGLETPPARRHVVSRAHNRAPLQELPGRWITSPQGVHPAWMAEQFKDRFPEAVERYLELALKEQDSTRAGPLSAEARRDLDQEEATLRRGLAEAVYQQGRREEALGHLRRAVELDGESAGAHAALAGLLSSSGRRDEAAGHYLRAVEIDPADAESHHRLGVTLRTAGQLDDAFRHLATAARLRPEWPAPLIPMVWMLISAEPDEAQAREAVRLAERAVELSVDRHPVALDTLAAAYAAAGRLEEARATAREGVGRAKALGNEALAEEIAGRLRRYEEGWNPR